MIRKLSSGIPKQLVWLFFNKINLHTVISDFDIPKQLVYQLKIENIERKRKEHQSGKD